MKLKYLALTLCLSNALSAASCDRSSVWQEIASRWHAIWQEQFQAMEPTDDLYRYSGKMMQFVEHDLEVAQQLIGGLLQGPLWDHFLKQKDVDATVAFIEHMKGELQKHIAEETELSFPPILQRMHTEIKESGMQEDQFISKVREAFLAFTLVVSRMYYLVSTPA